MPVTVIEYDPVDVEAEVVIVNLLVKVGSPDWGSKDADAPEGSPDTNKATGCVAPPVKVTVMVLEPEPP